MTFPAIESYTADREALVPFRAPALFLSASIPYARTTGTPEQLAANAQYLPPLRSEIREAVVQLARFAFSREVQLILGGHPAITPLVLRATRAVPVSDVPRVIVFQSAHFQNVIPQTTVELCNWDSGLLIWTQSDGPPLKPGAPPDPQRQKASLQIMREAMVSVSKLVGAVLVGGMDGVEDEAKLFQDKQGHKRLPRYALPNTGGAAKLLFDRDSRAFAGTLADPKTLDEPVASVAVRAVFEDLGLP